MQISPWPLAPGSPATGRCESRPALTSGEHSCPCSVRSREPLMPATAELRLGRPQTRSISSPPPSRHRLHPGTAPVPAPPPAPLQAHPKPIAFRNNFYSHSTSAGPLPPWDPSRSRASPSSPSSAPATRSCPIPPKGARPPLQEGPRLLLEADGVRVGRAGAWRAGRDLGGSGGGFRGTTQIGLLGAVRRGGSCPRPLLSSWNPILAVSASVSYPAEPRQWEL